LLFVNYLGQYVKLIRKAEQRGWTKKSAPCYVEKHHPFIRAIFGDNDRVVYLTGREHVVAHLLLFKACLKRYGKRHWKTWKAATAATAMGIIGKRHWGRTPVSCSTLGLAREVDAENKRIAYTGVPLPPRPGYRWYVNGSKQTRSNSHPGEGWVEGRLPYQTKPFEERNVTQESIDAWVASGTKIGKQHLETGQWEKVRCKDGRGGAAGIGNVWWNNGTICTRAKQCPGEGWVRGRIQKVK
jgi:hypothetical protein